MLAVSSLPSRTVPALNYSMYFFLLGNTKSKKKQTESYYCKITTIAAENLCDVTPAGMFTDVSFMLRGTTLASILPQSLTSSDV